MSEAVGQADVCPTDEAQPRGIAYLAFEGASGSIARMAVVRHALPRELGRYLVGEPIGAGGMALVHLGRIVGPAGFSRTVAIKRMHAMLSGKPELVARFEDEARISSRVRHPNVVQMLDVVTIEGELLLVLDYVHGESLAKLRKMASSEGERIPLPILSAIMIGVLRGLHAAHEATDAKGATLDIVHRDVSPQNVLVGVDGIPRVLDFGIARAEGREHETLVQDLKGKLAYMAPEQISGEPLDRRCDLFAAGVVIWETLAMKRLFRGVDAVDTMNAIFHREPRRLSGEVEGVTRELDDVVARALAKNVDDRFSTADEMARALEAAVTPAADAVVGAWVERIAGRVLAERGLRIAAFEKEERSFAGSETRIVTAPSSAPPAEHAEDEENPTLDAITERRGIPASLTPPAPLATPVVMVMPVDDSPSMTRFSPIEHLRTAPRTPIPMPAASQKSKRGSWKVTAALFVAPPAIAAGLVALMLTRPGAPPPPRAAAVELPPPAAVVQAADPQATPNVVSAAAPPPPLSVAMPTRAAPPKAGASPRRHGPRAGHR